MFAVTDLLFLAVHVQTVILGPAVFEHWIVDLESSSVLGCVGPVAVLRRYCVWFFPKILFERFFGF
jgi:hypothetical protein